MLSVSAEVVATSAAPAAPVEAVGEARELGDWISMKSIGFLCGRAPNTF